MQPPTGGADTFSAVQPLLTGAAINNSGSLEVQASTLSGLSTPVLRAAATSNAEKYTAIQALVAQGYTVGAGATANQQLNSTVNITENITNLLGNDYAGIAAQVGFTRFLDPTFDLINTALAFALLDENAVSFESTIDGPVNFSLPTSITVNPGEQFYLVAFLSASAGDAGGVADAMNTLTVRFDAPSAAVISPAAVPLPAPFLLMLSVIALRGLQLSPQR